MRRLAAELSGGRLARAGGQTAAVTFVVAGIAAALIAGCGRSGTQARSGAAITPSVSVGPSTTAACSNAAMVATWSMRRRVEQLVAVPTLQRDVLSALPSVRQGVGGVLLVGTGAGTDLGSRLAELKAQSLGGIAPLVMSDEEGGGVQRLARLVGSLPWARAMAATLTPERVRALAERTGRQMLANGVAMDLAPNVDLAFGPGPDPRHIDGPRSFSTDPLIANSYGLAFARGMLDAGVIPVVKHFPGEGAATANTDYGAAATPALASLEWSDLVPFDTAIKAGLPAIMVGNATVPGLSTGPASLSSAVITGLLRQRLGFHGLILTDSLSAGAISVDGLDVGQAAARAIAAGADMVLVGSGNPNTVATTIVDHVVGEVVSGGVATGRLNDAVANVLNAKGINLC